MLCKQQWPSSRFRWRSRQTQLLFQLYAGGVVKSSHCGTDLDHGVLVVGYGEEDGDAYWLVKNSWGPDWGEDGYVKIARSNSTSDPGVCGIGMQPSFPVAVRPAGPLLPCNFVLY